MDTQIVTWEMNLDSEYTPVLKEEIATGPFEPYTLDWNLFNWN